MSSLQTLTDYANSGSNDSDSNQILDLDTYKLIRDMCNEFHLTADIEFTCYESYTQYLPQYFCELNRRVKRTAAMESNNNCSSDHDKSNRNSDNILATNAIIDKILDELEKTSLLHVLALISICAKYINGYRSENLVKSFVKYLESNGTPYTVNELRNSEYLVFKCLTFNVSPETAYRYRCLIVFYH